MIISKQASKPVIVFILFILVGCSYNKSEIENIISKQLEENKNDHGIPAQALMIMHNQEVIYNRILGISDIRNSKRVDDETIFPIYSVTKLFASTLVMQLLEAGKLNLTDPVSKFVSNLPNAWRDIRIEQLLNHTSGLPEYFKCEDRDCQFPASEELAISQFNDTPLVFKPDTEMRYNQTNYLLLKAIIENVTKTPYRELVNSQIIKPLDLKNTWFGLKNVPNQRLITAYHTESGSTLKENKATFPDYAITHSDIYSTLSDMSKFLSAIAQGHLVSKEMLTQLWQPYRLSDGDAGYFATGWEYDSAGSWHAVGHDGGSVVRVRILYKDNLDDYYLIIYLTNGNKDGVWTRTLVESVQYYILPDLYSRMATML